MKKLSILLITTLSLFASDPITIDSLYKQQVGLRSITNLSLLSSGNPNVYTSTPNLMINGDPVVWDDTKQLTLSQTFIYALTQKFNLLTSFSGSYIRNEYIDFFTLEPKNQSKTKFDNLWIGLNYRGDKIGEFIPILTLKTAILQNESAKREQKKFYFKSYSLKASLKGYTDPVIYSIYTGFGYNQARKFSFAKINYGNTIFFGGDLSIVLSPKITLDLGAEQIFQTANRVNNKKTTNIRSIPTYSVGSTYSVDDDTSITFSANLGGSSAAPDSVFGVSIWQKF